MTTSRAELDRKLDAIDATVGVIGLGYVGLPLALALCERGFSTVGFDIDPSKVEALERGECYIDHIGADRVARARAAKKLSATTKFTRLGECDVIIVCVPTPLTPQREPDLSFVRITSEQIAACLRPGQLVVLESTTYPGTTNQVVRRILDHSGLSCGEDYFLAFSPEREDPGNRQFHTTNIPKVVGGVDPAAGDLAEKLYRAIIGHVVRVSNADAAEATKLTENIFRAVNIALVNELKVIYDRMGIDIWEVLDAASTKPFGFMRFNPGPGWGGHCIPLDPFYLAWKAREHELDAKFIELAGEVNRSMPGYVVSRLQDALNSAGKAVRGSAILVLGLAYKKNVGDTRESPAFQVMRRLIELGAQIRYHDPHVPEAPETRSWRDHPELRSIPLDVEAITASDAVVVITDHDGVDYALVREHAKVIVDSRGVYRGQDPKVVKA